ncbi:hypothetical protein BV898_18543 [Hypsibius exemplaris]|uniref:Protein kinase domain-containing protein n=1 Tax=Hypsibius exemplaris TaxID=2072580 RepID=A0A9X6RNK1_HYPEX|nr:hypothetical protein BV898_18543 [Hypsibius exemplaris]
MDDIAEFDVSHIEFMGEELKPGNLRRLTDKMDPDFNMLSTLLSIRHENIVSYFSYDLICVSDTSEISAIIASLRQCRFFEQAQGDDALSLLDFVRKTRVEMKQMIRYTLQLLDALDYLHSQNVPYILMALQTTSIKVTPDYASVKIFDWLNPFYFSPMLHHKHQILSGENFLYPDVLKRISEMETAGAKTDGIHFIDLIKPNVDVWSLGCVVLDMMSGGDLRHVDKNGIILDKSLSLSAWRDGLTDGGYPLIPSSAPDLVRRICKKCFRRDPLRQYTAKELTRFIQEAQEAGKHVKSIGDEIPPEVHQASATRPYCAVSISVDDMPRTSRDVLFSPEPAKTTKSIDCQLDEGKSAFATRL